MNNKVVTFVKNGIYGKLKGRAEDLREEKKLGEFSEMSIQIKFN